MLSISLKAHQDGIITYKHLYKQGSRSEESTPDIKKALLNFQQSLSIKMNTKGIEKKLLRRMTTPNFTR